ncbi:MAG: IclR family transcriptional regulator C-terminal domain-containing protein [Roseovarius sp.]
MYLASLARNHLKQYLAATDLDRRTPNTITDQGALTAEIETVRRQGYALDREEFMESMVALAVPVRDVHGRLMVTLSFHAPSQRFDVARTLACLPALRDASADLAKLVMPEDAAPQDAE